MPVGRAKRRRRAVSLEAGAVQGGPRCPACGKPLFVWIETQGWGPREDQLIDRCESCGLLAARGRVPSTEQAVEEILALSANGGDPVDEARQITLRTPNAASLQASLGAENWAGLRPGAKSLTPTPKALELLLAKRGLRLSRLRFLPSTGMAGMWQTLINLLTFHRDFAPEALSGRLRPGGGRGRAAYVIDAVATVLAATPTAILAAVLECIGVLARRGGVIEVTAERD